MRFTAAFADISSRSLRLPAFVILLVLTAVPAAALPDRAVHRHTSGPSAPRIDFDAEAIAVTNATPGGTVLLFGVVRRELSYAPFVQKLYRSQVTDASGSARFELGSPLLASSIFSVVDLESGAYVVATPEGFPLHFRHFPDGALRKRTVEYEELEIDTTWIEAFCVRPTKGAWSLFALDGAGKDKDATDVNGRIRIEAGAMMRLSGEAASPGTFRKNDVLIVIDPVAMNVTATAVPE